MRGKVKWYNHVKGYGFIQSEDNTDVFVHRTGLVNSYYGLSEGQTVDFDTKQGEKGLIAINVKVIKE